MGKAIQVENLSKVYRVREKSQGLAGSVQSFFKPNYIEKKALTGISMDIDLGEVVGFIGPNGAGKTTTLKILSGILHPTSGKVDVLGYLPVTRKNEFLKQIAMIMGNKSQLSWDLPAMDSYILLKKVYGLSDEFFKQQLDSMCDLFDIGKLLKRPVRQMSLGERMKCELVAALLHNPKIVFLDEPTLGLDAVSQKNFRDMIKEQKKVSGTTFLVTSHYMKDIKELCDRVIVIKEGDKVFDGQLTELERKYGKNKTVCVTMERPIPDLEMKLQGIGSQIKEIKASGIKFECIVDRDHIAGFVSKLFTLLPIVDISVQEPEIDEIIYNVYQHRGVV